jgi:hypothetical protein
MKMTRSAAAGSKSDMETIAPVVSGRENAGAEVPRGTIVEGVAAIVALAGVERRGYHG